MPGMSGTDLANLLRTRYPGLGVVIASGYAELPSDTATDATIPKLAKPFAQADLARMVAEHAGRASGTAGAAA
jgi:FixJ family two-component response regulator